MYAKGEGEASEAMDDGILDLGIGLWWFWSVRRGYGGITDEARNSEVLWIVMDADWTAFLLIGRLGLCKDFYVPARRTEILDLK